MQPAISNDDQIAMDATLQRLKAVGDDIESELAKKVDVLFQRVGYRSPWWVHDI